MQLWSWLTVMSLGNNLDSQGVPIQSVLWRPAPAAGSREFLTQYQLPSSSLGALLWALTTLLDSLRASWAGRAQLQPFTVHVPCSSGGLSLSTSALAEHTAIPWLFGGQLRVVFQTALTCLPKAK